jgi:hypothetical protein
VVPFPVKFKKLGFPCTVVELWNNNDQAAIGVSHGIVISAAVARMDLVLVLGIQQMGFQHEKKCDHASNTDMQ